MTPVVFAGPRIDGVDPAELAGIELRPPARCGDVLAATFDGAGTIGLIDGVFDTVASVWHKEILYALAAGVNVLGAASMGALRAAECAAFGMIGIGRIFAEYHRGERFEDGDVAVIHGPAEFGYRALTEALVNVEATLTGLGRSGLIAGDEHEALLTAARKIHFKERTWRGLIDAAGLEPARRSSVEALVGQHRIDRKREDAQALLAEMRHPQRTERSVEPITSERLNRSVFLEELCRRVAAARVSGG
jgi:hypothetical protein